MFIEDPEKSSVLYIKALLCVIEGLNIFSMFYKRDHWGILRFIANLNGVYFFYRRH